MAREKPAPPETPVLDGNVRLEPFVLKRLLIGRGWTLKDFCLETEMQMRTVRKIFGGERVQISTARSVAEEFGVTMLDIVDPAEYRPPTFRAEANHELGTGEWLPGRALTPVIETANKLQYRVYCMTHAFEPQRRGRGKRYEFEQLNDEARESIRHRFTRHLSVCSRLASHPQFPTCYTTFPDAERDAWWVIDEWIDGCTLAETLTVGALERELLFRVGRQLAEGIAVAHEADIILRELTPGGVILAETDQRVVLTDFELAKLTDDYPTVTDGAWAENDYRAPEIGAGDPTPRADVYSWGRIMVETTLGKLPERGKEQAALKFVTGMDSWAALLAGCVQLVPSQRPAEMQPILNDLAKETSPW